MVTRGPSTRNARNNATPSFCPEAICVRGEELVVVTCGRGTWA